MKGKPEMTTHTTGTCHFCGGPDAKRIPHGIYYDGCEQPAGVLRVWALNNVHWGDRPSEICACNQHPYQQNAEALVSVCTCGKWPAHHSHTGESYRTCGCDGCRSLIEMEKTATPSHGDETETPEKAVVTQLIPAPAWNGPRLRDVVMRDMRRELAIQVSDRGLLPTTLPETTVSKADDGPFLEENLLRIRMSVRVQKPQQPAETG